LPGSGIFYRTAIACKAIFFESSSHSRLFRSKTTLK
jgi:hypothetical protein